RRGDARRTDPAGYGDRRQRGGRGELGDRRAGAQRRARPHGSPLPLAGRAVPGRRSRMTSTPTSGDAMTDVLISGAKLYGEGDPVDVLLSGGVIAAIEPRITPPDGAEVIEADGQVLLPGFVDLHTHLREPGREDAETVATGSEAAALGGYTAVFAMANTDPVADNAVVVEHVRRAGEAVGLGDVHPVGAVPVGPKGEPLAGPGTMASTDPVADNAVVVEHVRRAGEAVGLVDVHPVGAVTVGLKGEQLAELGTMANSRAQVRMFSDDGHCVHDPLIMRRALEYTRALDAVVAQHAEEPRLTVGAQAHEGELAARLGLAGWPAAAEEAIVARDCILARHVDAKLHVCHVSTKGTVDVLRWAKERGTQVSTAVTPPHLMLTDERLTSYDPVNKVNPPLRTDADTEALRAALAEGVVDCVATDHAPHAPQDKDVEWQAA